MWHQPKNPYPPPHSISFPHIGQIPTRFPRLCCPSPLRAFLSFISSLCATLALQVLLDFLSALRIPLSWCLLPLFSLLRTWVGLLLIQLLLCCPSPLCAQVRFPWSNSHSHVHLLFMHGSGSAQPSSHSHVRLLFVHGLGSSWLDSRSPFCATSTWVWSSSMCMNLMQVGRAQFQRLKGARTSLVWTFCSSFFTAKGCTTWLFGSFILMSLCQLRDH
jgi:hypothetical protein